jgi:hypothetical protein
MRGGEEIEASRSKLQTGMGQRGDPEEPEGEIQLVF